MVYAVIDTNIIVSSFITKNHKLLLQKIPSHYVYLSAYPLSYKQNIYVHLSYVRLYYLAKTTMRKT